MKKFPTHLGFSSKARKFNARFFNFFEKSPKIIHFLQFSWEIFWKLSKFSGVRGGGGSAPRTPYEADPLKWPPPRTEILAAPLLRITKHVLETFSHKIYIHIYCTGQIGDIKNWSIYRDRCNGNILINERVWD